MVSPKIEPVLEEVSEAIADYTIGFTIVKTHNNIQDAFPAGSGSLVTVGSVHGILTAAHVLKNFPDQGEIGLVRFPKRQPIAAQRFIIDIDLAEALIIGTEPFGPSAPSGIVAWKARLLHNKAF